MEMRKCERGHYYDASLHAICPYCSRDEVAERTMAVGVTMAGATGAASQPVNQTVAGQGSLMRPADADEGKTIAMFRTARGIDPVVGWLICLEGEERGRDYRIHANNNYIGRSEKMDICIKYDDTISRENQAIIAYDSADNRFYFSPGNGRSIIRQNGKSVFQTTELSAYDRITIGNTNLVFLPLCGDGFLWEE